MAGPHENAARTDCAVFRAEANRFRSLAMRPMRGGPTPQYPLKIGILAEGVGFNPR